MLFPLLRDVICKCPEGSAMLTPQTFKTYDVIYERILPDVRRSASVRRNQKSGKKLKHQICNWTPFSLNPRED